MIVAFKKGHIPWNKGKRLPVKPHQAKGQTTRKRPQKPIKRAKKLLSLPLEQQNELALRLLYGSVDMATRVRGRKSKFREHMYSEGQKLAALGFTMQQIADFWNVHLRTLQRWAANKPDFRHTINQAKAEADLQVESSLYKRAKGYTYIEKTRELRPAQAVEGQPAGDAAMTLVKEVTKQVAPDVGAGVFWLLNRQPQRWKDKRQLEIPPGAKLPLEIIISNGDESKRLTAGAKDKDNLPLPAPRESTSKH